MPHSQADNREDVEEFLIDAVGSVVAFMMGGIIILELVASCLIGPCDKFIAQPLFIICNESGNRGDLVLVVSVV